VNDFEIARGVINKCISSGVREYIVCSGARNMALISALLEHENVVVWSHFEERAAGFFALGRMMDSREPCAVLTTSGTAVAELLPAVIESYYQARPLLLISADRPSNYRGSGAPQAIEQLNIFGAYAGASVDVEGNVGEIFQRWNGRMPWHINVCLGEDVKSDAPKLEQAHLGKWVTEREKVNVTALVKFLNDVWQGVIVCLGGLEPEDREEVFNFLKRLKIPVAADPASGLRELLGDLVIADPDKMLREQQVAKILRIGEVPIGRYWRDLEIKPEVEVLSLTRTGFSGLARSSEVISGDLRRIIRGVGEVSEVGDVMDVLRNNNRRSSQIDELLERFPDSEPAFVRMVSVYATMAESLYLGNSLPIREWSLFAQRDKQAPYEIVRANRGANGIDGQIATWAGWTHGIDDAWIIVGDLTTLYDLSAPSLLHDCDADGRIIVVINNGGGKIFDRLPRVRSMDTAQRELISNEHAFSFESWAMMWGWDYLRVDSLDDLEIEPDITPLVVELVPCEQQTKAFWEAYEQLI